MTNTIPSIAPALLSVGLIQCDGLLFGAEWATRLLPGEPCYRQPLTL